MAEIPVEKKGGAAKWLIPLLAILAIIALLFFLFAGDDDVDRAEIEEVDEIERAEVDDVETETYDVDTETYQVDTQTAQIDTNTRRVTDVALLIAARPMDRSPMDVDIDRVMVRDVISDAGFYVGDAQDPIFVYLDEVPTPDQPNVEGRYDINQGQTINLEGQLMTVADARRQGAENIPAGTNRVIIAQRAEIVRRS